MSSNIACSRGCFICNQRGDDGGNLDGHSGGCCKSTQCDSNSWNKQVDKWLKAEDKHRQKMKKLEEAMTVRWLISEKLWQEQQAQQQAVDEVAVEEWLAAEQQFRASLRVKAPKRVAVERQVNSPQIAKQRAEAQAAHAG